MGTANIILTAQPTTILQARHPRTIISNEGAVTAYLDDQSAVTADVNDFVLRPGERIAWAENVPCWAVGNGATISTSINVERFSTPSPDDWLRYVNSIPPTFPPYVPPSEPVPVVSGGLVKVTSGVFTAQNPLNIDSIFTGLYDDYLIRLKWSYGTALEYPLTLRFLTSGVPDTAANYCSSWCRTYTNMTTDGYNLNGTSGYLGRASGTPGGMIGMTIDVSGPALAEITSWTADQGSTWNVGAGLRDFSGGVFNDVTTFTGIQLIAPTTTITGRYAVYGYER